MKNSQIIKSKGYSTLRIETSRFKGVFGGNCNHVIALVNKQKEVLCYDGKPYFPAGRMSAYAALVVSGDINAKCFSFQSI